LSAKAVEHTVSTVKQETLAQLSADLKSSFEEAVRTINDSAKTVSQSLHESSQQHAKKMDAVRRQILGAAGLKSRNLVLSEIEKAIGEVFDEALSQLAREQSGEKRRAVLEKLISESIDITGGDSFVIKASGKDHALLSGIANRISKVKKVRLQVAKESISSIGGVTITSSDGYVSYDNTYEARLARAKPMLRKQLSEMFWRKE
jgi:vacuolar-type H+-ATPase subunit E/Vma4